MKREERRKAIEATYKNIEIEEWFDKVVTRPIGYSVTQICKRLGLHPNFVTIVSLVLGVGAAVCFYFIDWRLTVLGIALLFSANILDSVDGQLARVTGKFSLLGRVLDGFAGDVWFFCIYLSISLRLFNMPIPFFPDHRWGITIFVIAMVVCLISHMFQANMADYYRNIYLLFRTGKSDFSETKKVYAECRSLSWKTDWFKKFWLYFYGKYVSRQELLTPAFQKMYTKLVNKYGKNFPEELCQEMAQGTQPLIKWANILSFNTRAIALYISMLIGEPWLYLLFVIIIMDSLMAYMVLSHESVCRKVTKKYL